MDNASFAAIAIFLAEHLPFARRLVPRQRLAFGRFDERFFPFCNQCRFQFDLRHDGPRGARVIANDSLQMHSCEFRFAHFARLVIAGFVCTFLLDVFRNIQQSRSFRTRQSERVAGDIAAGLRFFVHRVQQRDRAFDLQPSHENLSQQQIEVGSPAIRWFF